MGGPEKGSRRYPHLRVALRSEHPLALVAAVRQELRRAGIDSDEIDHFSREALSDDDPDRARQICAQWVDVDPRGSGLG